jgi:gliding motility-associated-like protein
LKTNFSTPNTMKKFLLLIAIIFSGITSSYATHLMGAEITYVHVGGDDYEVTLIVYRDCSGVNLSTVSANTTFESASCGQNFNFALPYIQTVDVSQVCPGQTTTCNGGTVPGTEQFVYRGIVTLTPCSDWIMHWNSGNRNPAITNLVSPNTTNLYVQNTLNNVIGAFNNSPQFFNVPTPYLCVNQLAIYSHAASDVDGDSLYYEFNNPLTTPGPPGTPIPFTGGYSLLQPMITSAGMNLNQQTGEMCFTPSQTQISVVSVIITEFRNGILIGSQIREMQVIVDATCTNQNPTTGAVATCGGSGGMTITVAGPSVTQTDPNSITMCPNDNVCLEITFSDPDPGDNITVLDNIAAAIPGATWSVANDGTPSPIGTFCWTPTALDSGINVFSLILEDDACPISGTQTFTYDITVFDEPYAGADQIICGTQGAQLNASGGATYTWFDAATNILVPVGPAFSCNPCINPIATPTVTTDYYVLSSLTAACENTDTVRVTVVPDFTPDALGDTTFCDYLTRQLDVVITSGLQPGIYTYLWNNGTTLSDSTIQNPIASPTDSTWYVVEVTSPDGCSKTVDSVLVGVVIPPSVELIPGNDTLCLGETSNFDVSLVAISDDFDGGFDPSVWSNVSGASTGTPCVPFNGDALLFNAATRELTTNSISTTNCTSVDFCLWIANNSSTGTGCENADAGEDVVLNYSISGAGGPWVTIQTFNTGDWDTGGPYANAWQCFSISIPAAAQTGNTMFQWAQIGGYGGTIDNWALDDINISCGGSTAYQYLWSPATNLSNPAINDPIYTSTGIGTTTYTVTITDPGSGCSFDRSQDITVLTNNLNIPTLTDTFYCEGSSVDIDGGAGYVTYQWNPSGGNAQIGTINQPGTYSVTVSNGTCTGTSNTITVTEIANPHPVILGDITVCDGENTTLSVNPVYDSYLWSNGSTFDSTIVLATAGNVQLVVDSAGCTTTTSVTITSVPTPSTTITGLDTVCPGESLTVGTSGGPFDSYLWSPNNATTASTTTPSGIISVTITQNGCDFTANGTIFTHPNPVADFTISPEAAGEPNIDIVFTDASTNASSWIWDFDVTNISPNPSNETGVGPFTFVYENQGTYTVTLSVANDDGCTNSITKQYLVFSDIGTPNIITPNGDGMNDFLVFQNLDASLFSNHITVLNRWGKKVYEQDNYNNDWDGDNLKEGTYFYVLQVDFNTGEEVFKGTLTILR